VYSDIHPLDPKNQIEFKKTFKRTISTYTGYFPKNHAMFSGALRSFQMSWYQQFTWFEYSPKEDLAFCFPSRMFSGSTGLNVGQSEKVYSKIGYKNRIQT